MTRQAAETPFGKVYGDIAVRPLVDYVFFQEGPGLRKWQWTDRGMKVINGRNILADHTIDLSNTDRHISLEEFQSRYSHFAVQNGDIVVTSSGTIGKVARIRPEHLPLMMNTSVIRFHPRRDAELDAAYLHAFLRSPYFQRQAHAFAIGAAQPNFGPAHIREMKILWRPLRNQRKIAAILSTYDDLIENYLRRIAILEVMARLIYREWFVNFRFPGHESVTKVDSPLGPIPEGVEVAAFATIAELSREGVNPGNFPDETFAHFSFPAFDSGRLPALERGDTIHSNKFLVSSECVLLSKLNPRIPRVWHAVPPTTYRAVASTEFLVMTPAKQIPLAFLFSLCSSDELLDRCVSLALGTSTSHQRVKPDDLMGMMIVVPDRRTLAAFARCVTPMQVMIERMRIKIATLRRSRDLLLPKLISGDLDVSELDINVGATPHDA